MTPYYEDDFATIYHGDALEVASDLDAFPLGYHGDLVVMDLPYNVGKAYDGYADDLPMESYWAWVRDMLDSFGGVTLAWFPGANNITRALSTLDESIWAGTFRRLLAWHKKEYAGDVFHSGPAMCWEPIVWCGKYHNVKYGAWGRDLLVVPSTHGDPLRAHHPCPKPPEVLRWLIGLFTPDDGGTVVDPTMGTGTSLLEAKYLGRKAIGIEQSERYCEIAAKRLAQEVLDFGGVA